MKIKLVLFLLVFSYKQSILSMNLDKTSKVALALGIVGIAGSVITNYASSTLS